MGTSSGKDGNRAASTAAAAAEQTWLNVSPVHGGDLDFTRKRFPGAPEPWIDLSTGINPFPYARPDIPESAWTRLPLHSDEHALLIAAAVRYGAAGPDNVVAAAGSQGLIQVVPRLVPPARVAILSPTYAEHRHAWSRAGHEVSAVASFEALAGADVAVVVNPNNPTGRLIPPSDLAWLAGRLGSRSGILVVDEAFLDVLEPSASLIPALPSATLVLRSFGKTYGLAGLRLGFAVSEPAIVSRMRDLLGPWPVSGPALVIGRAALTDDGWLCTAKERLERESGRLDRLLEAAGLAVVGGTPLFRLVAHEEAARIAANLGRQGILVRAFDYAPQWLRFGIPGSPEAWERLENALKAV